MLHGHRIQIIKNEDVYRHIVNDVEKKFSNQTMNLKDLYRDQNNVWSLDMTKLICRLIGHIFNQYQALSDQFVNKRLFSSFLGFKLIYQESRNSEPKRCLFTT